MWAIAGPALRVNWGSDVAGRRPAARGPMRELSTASIASTAAFSLARADMGGLVRRSVAGQAGGPAGSGPDIGPLTWAGTGMGAVNGSRSNLAIDSAVVGFRAMGICGMAASNPPLHASPRRSAL